MTNPKTKPKMYDRVLWEQIFLAALKGTAASASYHSPETLVAKARAIANVAMKALSTNSSTTVVVVQEIEEEGAEAP